MGVAASVLAGAKVVIDILADLFRQYRSLNDRLSRDPGLPPPSPTRSFWLDNPLHPELLDMCSDALPTEADIVIIGSGITAAAVARSALDRSVAEAKDGQPLPSVVVLEARQLCSGATGRNGGHIKSSPHEILHSLMTKRGMPGDRAAALVRFQLAHLDQMLQICAAEPGLQAEAECRQVETVDLFMDGARFVEAQRMVDQLKQWVPEFDMQVWTASAAQEMFSAGPHVVGAISYRAGALWPHRLVVSLWRRLLDAHPDRLSIETGTPVTAVEVADAGEKKAEGGRCPYLVHTPRGTVRARHVVHATNAYASQLLPRLRRKMTGLRAHMSAQRPGARFPDLDGRRSWSIIFASGFDYITQRPTRTAGAATKDGAAVQRRRRRPGEVMAGGGFTRSASSGLDQLAVYDDTAVDLLTATHLHGVLPVVFGPHWGPDARPDAGDSDDSGGDGHIKRLWSGIIAFTADLLPLVGRLDPQLTGRKVQIRNENGGSNVDAGEWISAAYIGDGMVWAWLCGTALGLMVTGRDQTDLPPMPGRPGGRLADWFPPELLATPKRLQKMDIANLADMIM